jgi:hypothetical protein
LLVHVVHLEPNRTNCHCWTVQLKGYERHTLKKGKIQLFTVAAKSTLAEVLAMFKASRYV